MGVNRAQKGVLIVHNKELLGVNSTRGVNSA